jgi:hypothetical protein
MTQEEKKNATINLRCTFTEKNELTKRAYIAGCGSLSAYILQALFVHDAAEDLRAAWLNAVEELKREREAMKAARESLEEGISLLIQNRNAANVELVQEVRKIVKDSQGDKKFFRVEPKKENKTDTWLFPCLILTAFFVGVVFF